MQKPTGVTLASAIMAVFIVIGLVLGFTAALPPSPNPSVPAGMMGMIMHVGAIVGALISAVFVFFFYAGQNWARWVVMIYSVLVVVQLVFVMKTWNVSHAAAMISIAKALLAIYLLWYLNTPLVRDWYSAPKSPTAA